MQTPQRPHVEQPDGVPPLDRHVLDLLPPLPCPRHHPPVRVPVLDVLARDLVLPRALRVVILEAGGREELLRLLVPQRDNPAVHNGFLSCRLLVLPP
eukprot:CAMPEP_0206218462 /NCGR_PEP_ID=MMETSP0047_2-20121206/3812_1 /ASSEMBLY_ACC=CAM_ASM_000192 /TAXON_ID=195065 /ORGANISM="Chroomonas mesostigmatica_cf, Strain CCMP1168" /LENGTH=96 /DNA_ID=CAMNT_0053640967 /DNA_START=862 /DNA_END=1149 /DNA_ORIENTATION=-